MKDGKKTWSIEENGLYLVLESGAQGEVRILHFSSALFDAKAVSDSQKTAFGPVELQVSGENQNDHHGSKHTGGTPGIVLKHRALIDKRTGWGRKLEWTMEGGGLAVTLHLQFYDGVRALRSWAELRNEGTSAVPLEYLSSFALTGLAKESFPPGASWEEAHCRIHIPHNTWYGEAQWKAYGLDELGLYQVNDFSMKRIALGQVGTWPCSEHLPMGALETRGNCLLWQIEAAGSWHWEVSDQERHLYLKLGGPSFQEHAWSKRLAPGESFESVPAAIVSVNGGFENAMAEMTKYRRLIRRPNDDNVRLPVIFNDYMNCLSGDPTTRKLLPLIDAAARAGCEYFCIDAGWYSDGPWWEGVGEWLPSKQRFPNGIQEPLDFIRSRGMIPGLWLEIEVMGIQCPLVAHVNDGWFFMRNGRRVVDHGRYQLDFRNPEVVAHADGVIRRLVEEYGVGYIKMDYNNNTGVGTETEADSFGDGLLQHNRAYLDWLDGAFDRYPGLVIENCSSGGMRMEYAHLSRHSIQSVTDQTDYLKMASISAACATAATPEQAAIWSYPLGNGNNEEVVFNMVNTLLLRIHQSGHLAELPEERFDLVHEAIALYKTYREKIPGALPFWPLGLPSFADEWISFGLAFTDGTIRLAVWHLPNGRCEMPFGSVHIPLGDHIVEGVEAHVVYPSFAKPEEILLKDQNLVVTLRPGTARLILVE